MPGLDVEQHPHSASTFGELTLHLKVLVFPLGKPIPRSAVEYHHAEGVAEGEELSPLRVSTVVVVRPGVRDRAVIMLPVHEAEVRLAGLEVRYLF